MITESTVIAGIIGAAGTAIALIIKSLFSRNQNSKDRMDHEENLIKLASSMSDVNDVVKELKTDLADKLNKIDEKIEGFQREQEKTNVATLRHSITSTYEEYKDDKKMPNIVYESTMSLYDCYKRQGGNSYVDEEVEKMKGWDKF